MEWHEIKANDNKSATFPERSIPGYEEVFNKQVENSRIACKYLRFTATHVYRYIFIYNGDFLCHL